MLKSTLFASLGVSMRAAITGLPASFLLSGRTLADTVSAKYLVVAVSSSGESYNVSGPGTYADMGIATVAHPVASRASAVSVAINGVNYTAADLENSATVRLGDRRVEMARAYTALPADLLEHLVWFNYRSGTNAHGELPAVMQLHGTLRGASGRGLEELPSAIAQENAAALGTVVEKPLCMRSGLSFQGGPLSQYNPQDVKLLFERSTTALGGLENFNAMYDHMIDEVYRQVKSEGTPKQKRFLDNHASSRAQAAQVGEDLNSLLVDVNDNSLENQIKLALASIKVKLTPVVVINHSWSGDNHQDSNLAQESERTLQMIGVLDFFWQQVKAMGLSNDVLFSTIDVFGRTTQLNSSGGRNHSGAFTSGILLGQHLKGGFVGGIESAGGNRLQSAAFNAQTGLLDNPDVGGNETLGAYLKTQMMAAGVSSQRCDVRIPEGKSVTSIV